MATYVGVNTIIYFAEVASGYWHQD